MKLKRSLPLTTILSTAALTSVLLLAIGCPLSKMKNNSGETSNLKSEKMMFKKMAIAGTGVASLAGLLAVGIAAKARRTNKADSVVSNVPLEESFKTSTFRIVVPPEALTSSTAQEDAAEEDFNQVG
ncbi:MAG TPA: hypothetical protein DCE56_03290 [Cyanobacteria bacterium UBA8553]|nr:hypothetical protein [Cyanobacteria bacterium UBA8553]HAJ61411.1 hypothetical protein [Cyanobacteria bacterium UBA8543]